MLIEIKTSTTIEIDDNQAENITWATVQRQSLKLIGNDGTTITEFYVEAVSVDLVDKPYLTLDTV
jgi:hypothetical protein